MRIMTTTVKLPNALEMTLRRNCGVSGESISDVIRVALEAHLSTEAIDAATTPFALGAECFGCYAGLADLSETFRESRGAASLRPPSACVCVAF